MPALLRAFLLICLLPALHAATFPSAALAKIDDAISQAVTDAKMPGAVFRMERADAVYEKAYGDRAIFPRREPMTADTIFDAASLTKVIATTSAVMKLVEAGQLDVEAPASHYLPEFRGSGKEAITLRQLLTHTSGLRAGLPHGDWQGKDGALTAACAEPLPAKPGTAYRYSDINFILLGLIVERASGSTLDAFCAKEIFQPLKMKDTAWRSLEPGDVSRIAPTTVTAGKPLRGIVHDPTARRMGGVAGHAGVFSTVDDLAVLAQAILNGGVYRGHRILTEHGVHLMQANFNQKFPDDSHGLGFELDQIWYMGGLSGPDTMGHTGFTGTSLVIDPRSRSFAILLTNRVHPSRHVETGIQALRRGVSNAVSAAWPF